MNELIKPEACTSKEDIRTQIDIIDHELIELFSLRLRYAEAIVKFKKDEKDVIAEDRKNSVITQRGEWAASKGLNPETFEKIYELLINCNIRKELEILKKINTKN